MTQGGASGAGGTDVADGSDWVRRMSALTVEPEDDARCDGLDSARSRVTTLGVRARGVLALDDAEVDAAFAALVAGDDARALAHELAASLPLPPVAERLPASADATAAVRGYLRAVTAAASAVYYCRRVQHTAGACWFSVRGPAHDCCGHVLVVAHALSDSAPHQRSA